MTTIRLSRTQGLDADKEARQKIKKIVIAAAEDMLWKDFNPRTENIKWNELLAAAKWKLLEDGVQWFNFTESKYLLTLLENMQPYSSLAVRLKMPYSALIRVLTTCKKQGSTAVASMGLGLKLIELLPDDERDEIVDKLTQALGVNFSEYLFLDLTVYDHIK